MLEFSEWLPDLPDYENPGTPSINNVYPAIKSYRPVQALAATSSNALDGTCLGAASVKDNTGVSYTFAGDASKLYALSADEFVDQSKSGGYYTPEDYRWRFEQFGNYVIAANGYDAPQKYDLRGAGPFEDLGGSPPVFQYMAVVRDFLVTGVEDGDGSVLRWPSINTVESWTVGSSQADRQVLPTGGGVTGVFGGEYGLVFQENRVTRMTYIGSPVIFQFDTIEENHGCIEPNSAIQYGKYVAYLSHNGFYICDGAASRPIGDQKVDKTFFADLDQEYIYNISAAVDPVNKLFVWAYPGTGNTNGAANKLIIYNWAIQRWSTATIDIAYLFTSLTRGKTLEELDDINESIDDLPASLDSRRWKGGQLQLGAFDTDNYLSTFSGDNLAATLETTEGQPVPGSRTRVRFARPMVDVSSATLQVGARTRLADTVSWGSSSAMDSNGRCSVRTYDRYLRARVNIPSGASWTHAQGVDFTPIAGGGR